MVGQCNPSIFPTEIYYSNSTVTPTNVSGPEYLCGPNTIVYDTVEIGCRFVYANAFSTLYFKPTISCATASYIWLKSNSILNLVQGTGPTFVIHELGAIINNPFGVTISSSTCVAITFPVVNCTPTVLKENAYDNHFDIYPNPANDVLKIVSINEIKPSKIEILNCFGQLIKKETVSEVNSFNIKINDLPNGIYTLNLDNSGIRSSKKFVVLKQ